MVRRVLTGERALCRHQVCLSEYKQAPINNETTLQLNRLIISYFEHSRTIFIMRSPETYDLDFN